MTDKSTPTSAAFDWNDPESRRRLCTALAEIINQHAPEGENIVTLADQTPTLTVEEVEVIKSYFGMNRVVGQL